MKSFFTGTVLTFICSVSFATSPMLNAILTYEVTAKSGNSARCTLARNVVTIEKNNKVVSKTEVEVNQPELQEAVKGALSTPLKTTRMYMVAHEPKEVITAAVYPTISAGVIFRDYSRQEKRINRDADDLIKQVKAVCGNLKP